MSVWLPEYYRAETELETRIACLGRGVVLLSNHCSDIPFVPCDSGAPHTALAAALLDSLPTALIFISVSTC